MKIPIIVNDIREKVGIMLGRRGENKVREVVFDISYWINEFGADGRVDLVHRRNAEEDPHPITTTRDGSKVTWLVTNTDTLYDGDEGRAELRYIVGDQLAKSKTYETTVEQSEGEAGEAPDPYESWLDDILEAAGEASGYAQAAETAASTAAESATNAATAASHYPYINTTNKHWMVWSVADGEYVDTGVVAEGRGGGGTGDHRELTNRDAENQHPMTAITGLPEALAGKQPSGDYALESDIPTALSQLSEDSTHSLVTDAEKQAWNAKQNALTADVDYATPEAVQQNISAATTDMATETWVEGKGYITAGDIPVVSVNGKTGVVVLTAADLGIGSVFDLKGSVATKTALPATGNKAGDVYYVIDESVGYIWLNDGTVDRWEMLGMSVDLSNYVTTTALASALNGYVAKVAGKGLSTNDFTDAYKTKLDSAITSLVGYATEQWVEGKGYLTEHQSLAAYRTSAAQDIIDGGKQPTLVSGTNIKTFNGNSILGSGNLTVREMPSVTSADAGKFARVNDSGEWVAEAVPQFTGGDY